MIYFVNAFFVVDYLFFCNIFVSPFSCVLSYCRQVTLQMKPDCFVSTISNEGAYLT